MKRKFLLTALMLTAIILTMSGCDSTGDTSGISGTEYNISITILPGSNVGYVTPSKTKATAGSVINLTITPESGFELETITASGGVSISGSGNSRQFVMPAANVTVTATFKAGTSLVSDGKNIYFGGFWGSQINGGMEMYPSDDCIEVWPAGYGVAYDEPITGGYQGSSKAIHFDHAVTNSQINIDAVALANADPNKTQTQYIGWAGAALFFESGSGVSPATHELRFVVKGTGGFEGIQINRYGHPWVNGNVIQNLAGSAGNGLRGMAHQEWTEKVIQFNSNSAEIGAILFVISATGGANSDFYIDNVRFVPK